MYHMRWRGYWKCKPSSVQKSDKTVDAFFALLRAGLWEQGVRLSAFEEIDFSGVLKLSLEQSVTGLVAAGLEHVEDVEVPEAAVFSFVNKVFLLERLNADMNRFIARLFEKMKAADITSLLVKGQGVAQCYDRPLWRSRGDVDLFLDDKNYEQAKLFFHDFASVVKREDLYSKHVRMFVGTWEVELHGNMRAGVTARMDRLIDSVQKDTFENGSIRVWKNGDTEVLMPSPDNDIIIVFTHILHHFYRGGIGLRQICDWCRLLFTFKDQLDRSLLEERINAAGIMPEWKGFGQFSVLYLGMPAEYMPFYETPNALARRRIQRICSFILETGNFGHNRDKSYSTKYPFLIRKCISFWRKGWDILHHCLIFPANSFRYFFRFLVRGLMAVARGVG